MVELRKRPSTSNVAPPPAKRSSAKKSESKAKATAQAPAKTEGKDVNLKEEAIKDESSNATIAEPVKASSEPKTAKVGDRITMESFGGDFNLTDGTEKATLKTLLDKAGAGVIVFTYPKASTPGCTKQACLFRDSHKDLTASGFSIYGLSRDSVKANTNFKDKQKLQYDLICDESGELIKALGFHKPPKSTTRGVAAIAKDGKVLALQAGGPDATVEAVRPIVKEAAAK